MSSLTIDRNALETIYAGWIKLIVPASDAAHIREALLDGDAPSAGTVRLLEFVDNGSEDAGRLRLSGQPETERAALTWPPSGLCVLAALSEDGLQELGKLVNWWARQSPDGPPPLLDLRRDAEGNGDLNDWPSRLCTKLLELACQVVRLGDERLAETRREVYELRTEYEQARHAMKAMQDRLWLLACSHCHLEHVLWPSGNIAAPDDSSDTNLIQPLPISAEGLAAIDLFVPTWPPKGSGEGHLLISLVSRDAGRTVRVWRIPYARLAGGWFRCNFPTALADPLHHLDLVVTWHTLSGTPPRLGLSDVGPFPEAAAQMKGRSLNGALAMLIWGNVPGARASAIRSGLGQAAGLADAEALEYELTQPDFQRIRPLVKAHFEYSHPLWDATGFRLHPLDNVLAASKLESVCLPGTDRVIAIGQIRHPEAALPVEYAMCLTDAAVPCSKFPDSPERDPRVLGFSGWQAVPADAQPHAVVLNLDRPLTVRADLLCATRMPDGLSITHEWADWLGVRIRLRGIPSLEPLDADPGNPTQ